MSKQARTENRITRQTEEIVEALAKDPTSELSGSDIAKLTGLKSGTLYPALLRLHRRAWLTYRWEDIDPSVEKRPRRRLYKLTGEGERAANQLAGEAAARQRSREYRERRRRAPRGATT
jgi:PadR family transcriptional regulator, regulatory protein PadR